MKYLTKLELNKLKTGLSKIRESEFTPIRLRRIALIIELLMRSGLRTEELCTLQVKDLDVGNSTLHVKTAKGGSNRTIPLNEKFAHHLAVEILDQSLRANDYVIQIAWLTFTPSTAKNFKRYLQDEWAKLRFKILGSGYDHITLHSLRHTFAIRLIEETKDVFKVQKALGHKSLTSTQVYMSAMYEKDMKEDILKAIS